MAFERIPADDYDRFMGRFSGPLADALAEDLPVTEGARALDVGAGPGAVTRALRARGARVDAVEPSPEFVAALRERFPDVTAVEGVGEELPHPDGVFDVVTACLVVHFLSDPVRGAAEMVRVARPGGALAACVWDQQNDRAPYAPFARAVREVTGRPEGPLRTGTAEGDLGRLLRGAGCREVEERTYEVEVRYASFDEWWDVHTLGVGSVARRLDGLDADGVAAVRDRARTLVGDAPVIRAAAWAARGTA